MMTFERHRFHLTAPANCFHLTVSQFETYEKKTREEMLNVRARGVLMFTTADFEHSIRNKEQGIGESAFKNTSKCHDSGMLQVILGKV